MLVELWIFFFFPLPSVVRNIPLTGTENLALPKTTPQQPIPAQWLYYD